MPEDRVVDEMVVRAAVYETPQTETPLMTTANGLAHDPNQVKLDLTAGLADKLEVLLGRVEDGASPRELELGVWGVVLDLGRSLLATALGRACQRSTEADLQRRGLGPEHVRMRLERDYWTTLTTTLGEVCFPLDAYRDSSGPLTVTRTPARTDVLPLLSRCRASELCVEWEARLGAEMPFRRAEEALSFFSHGAVEQHDTTIAAHMVAVGCAIERSWLYRPVSEFKDLLENRAARDEKTGRPVVYVSSDAHAERRYVDETWDAAWKMVNGIRLWIVDRFTGGIIHLGGEFTWGDCHEVGRIMDELVEVGLLPRDGDYGGGTLAKVVVVTDGCPWIEDYVVAKLPWSVPVLDLYHALEKLASFATKCFGAGSKAAKAFYRRVSNWLAPRRTGSAPKPKRRRGHKKQSRRSKPVKDTSSRKLYSGWSLLGALYEEQDGIPAEYTDAYDALLNYFEHNTYRMEYQDYAARGYQVGSGAMESLHRTGGQLRLKIPGGRWLETTSLAIFNLRMLRLAGRWDEFWTHDGITPLLVQAFEAQRTDLGHREAA